MSVLRFPLEQVYEDANLYPPPMLGVIEVHDKRSKKAAGEEGETQTGAIPDVHDDDDAAEQTALSAVQGTGGTAAATQIGQPAPVRCADAQPHSQQAVKPAPTNAAQATAIIRAPTFNKPKALTPKSAPVTAPTQAPVSTSHHDAAEPIRPKTGAKAAVAPQVQADESLYLDADDSARMNAMKREREQHQLVKAEKQVRKVASKTQKQTSPSAIAPAAVKSEPVASVGAPGAHGLMLLEQPVGSAFRLLLPGTPVTAGRSVLQEDDATYKQSACFKPVVLEQRKPTRNRDAERETAASPIALAFIGWLQQSLASRSFKYNETGAPVHFVEQGMALVSPLIFKMYAATQVPESEIGDHALQVQREVIKASWHVPGPNNTNILRYQVIGRGGTVAGRLAAVVLEEPGRFVQPVPPSNPALKLQ